MTSKSLLLNQFHIIAIANRKRARITTEILCRKLNPEANIDR